MAIQAMRLHGTKVEIVLVFGDRGFNLADWKLCIVGKYKRRVPFSVGGQFVLLFVIQIIGHLKLSVF
jgi:hypothetical protein